MAVFYKYEYTNKRKNIHPWGGVGVEEMKQMAAKGVAERVQQLPGWPGGRLQLEALPSVLQLHFAFAYQVLVVEQQKKLA